MTAYFLYSALLDPETRARAGFPLPKAEVAEARGLDLLFNLHSEEWGGRVASLVARSGQAVYGLVFTPSPEDKELLRRAEGPPDSRLQELAVKVRVNGKQVSAITFVTTPEWSTLKGPVSERYAEALARGAQASGLPKHYSDRLKTEAALLKRVQAAGRTKGLA